MDLYGGPYRLGGRRSLTSHFDAAGPGHIWQILQEDAAGPLGPGYIEQILQEDAAGPVGPGYI